MLRRESEQLSVVRIRERWRSPTEFVLVILAYTVGLGNLWRFPYLCYKHGGGSFLICYCVAIFAVCLPYFFMELALGQFMQSAVLGIWQICPIFKGIGWASMIIAFYFNIYYTVILAWALLYLLNSLAITLPWSDCGNWWNTESCLEVICEGSRCKNVSLNATVSSTTEYWERRILQVTDRIEHVGSLQWELVGTLLLIWILCFLCIWKGIGWTGRIVYLTVLTPYGLLIILLFRVVFLDGALDGIKHYFTPDIDKLLDTKVWFAALSQAMYSTGLGFGTLVAIGSFNSYRYNTYRQIMFAAIIEFLTSIGIGFIAFCIIGFKAHLHTQPFSEVISSESGLAFIIYPTVVLEFPWSPLWAVVFFLAFILLGIDSQFCCLEGFIAALMDEFYVFLQNRRQLLLFCVCLVKFLLGLICLTQGGMYVFHLIDNYAVAGWCVFTVVFSEGCVVAHIFGVNNFYRELEVMYGTRPCYWWKISWFVISPIVVLVITIAELVRYQPLKYIKYVYPIWANLIGWLMSFESILCIPLYMIFYLATRRGSLKQRLKKAVRPSFKMTTPKMSPEEQSRVIEMQSDILELSERR